MTQKNFSLAPARVASVALAALLPVAVQAQSASDEWKWNASIYGWFPAIGGESSYPVGGGGSSVDVSSQQVVEALQFAFMGTIEGKKGQWGFLTDLVYADFGASKSRTRDATIGQVGLPVGVTADLDLDVKTWIWTTAGTYSLVAKPEYTSDLVFGARLLDMTNRLKWTFSADIAGLPSRSGSGQSSVSNWDAIVGFKGRANFGADRKWFIPYYVDVGTGQTRFTWQAIAGLGYEFNWGSVIAAWRYLGYDMKADSQVQNVSMSGPALGVVFRW